MTMLTSNMVAPTRSVFEGLLAWLVSISERSPQLQKMERLNKLTDAQLQARGLRREDIAREVFGGSFYI